VIPVGDRPKQSLPEKLEAGWEEHRRSKIRLWLRATPAQRLAWLEEAIRFAHRSGALDRHPGSGATPEEDFGAKPGD